MKKDYVFSLNEIKVIASILGYNWIIGFWDYNQMENTNFSFHLEIKELQNKQIIHIPFNGEIQVAADVHRLFDIICNPLRIETFCKNNEPENIAYCSNQCIVVAKRIGFSKYCFRFENIEYKKISKILISNTSKKSLFEISSQMINQWFDSQKEFELSKFQKSVQKHFHQYSSFVLSFFEEELDTYVIHIYIRKSNYYCDDNCFSFVKYKDTFFQICQKEDNSLVFYPVVVDNNEV